MHLARLLRLDEITPVAVPTVDQEAARDLVRAREECRGDLMRARHRMSKLLLRHGIVYYGGDAWTGKHDAWLRQRRARAAGRRDPVGLRRRLRRRVGTPGPSRPARRGDPGDGRRLGVHRPGATAGLPARDRRPDRARARGRDRRLAPVHRQDHRLLRRAGPQRALLRAVPSPRGRSPRPATPTSAGCSSRRPGTTEAPLRAAKTMRERWDLAPAAARTRGDQGNRRLHPAGPGSTPARSAHHRQHRDRPRTGRLVLVPGRARGIANPRSASSYTDLAAARGATRVATMSKPADRW